MDVNWSAFVTGYHDTNSDFYKHLDFTYQGKGEEGMTTTKPQPLFPICAFRKCQHPMTNYFKRKHKLCTN